jgi:Phosphoglycerol transferase and related proteins, alkaline phosphatase superfamily
LSEIPISTSSAYFSNYYFANIVSVNPLYNIMENISNGVKFDSQVKFNYMTAEAATKRVKKLHQTNCDDTQSLLKTKRPNIVIVLLESWSADLVESLGGEPIITPVFKDLEKDGILFTNFYASGNRSQQGIASIYSGIPAVPVTTITNHPEKYHACKSLVKVMDSVGYTSSFYFGGQLNYGNILSFLKYLGFDNIVEGKDIKGAYKKGKLGIHDSDMMPWYAKQLDSEKQPFFSTVFTLSSHSPYDNPKLDNANFEWCKLEREFIQSAHYTDYSLGLFMEEAKKHDWYDNTIFVFMADHSHNTYRNHKLNSFEYHHIPLLITGDPLIDSLKGTQNEVLCGNTDFPAFLLSQMGIPHEDFKWSKDFMNKCYNPFAFFEMGEGVAWKTPLGEFTLSNKYGFDKKDLPKEMTDSIVKDGKSYMQHWYDEFSSY